MTGSPRPLRSIPDAREPYEVLGDRVRGLVVLGGLVAALGVAVGVRMALHATRIECPDGTEYSGPSVPKCYAHHHAGEGTAIAVMCVVLFVLVALAAVFAEAIVAARSATSG